MEGSDNFGHMWRDDRLKRLHADRRFLARVTGSPKTSSKDRPFLPVL
jgi:hypothetical protein